MGTSNRPSAQGVQSAAAAPAKRPPNGRIDDCFCHLQGLRAATAALVDGSLVVRPINRGYTASGERLFKIELSVSVLPEPMWSETMTLQRAPEEARRAINRAQENVPSFKRQFREPVRPLHPEGPEPDQGR